MQGNLIITNDCRHLHIPKPQYFKQLFELDNFKVVFTPPFIVTVTGLITAPSASLSTAFILFSF